jgi:hypothetical protein
MRVSWLAGSSLFKFGFSASGQAFVAVGGASDWDAKNWTGVTPSRETYHKVAVRCVFNECDVRLNRELVGTIQTGARSWFPDARLYFGSASEKANWGVNIRKFQVTGLAESPWTHLKVDNSLYSECTNLGSVSFDVALAACEADPDCKYLYDYACNALTSSAVSTWLAGGSTPGSDHYRTCSSSWQPGREGDAEVYAKASSDVLGAGIMMNDCVLRKNN